MATANLAIPMKLDAFVLNEDACNGSKKDVRIAPITQPNYTFLRIEDNLLQNDVLDFIDPHNSIPAKNNPRVTDLGSGTTRPGRLGVYLHWILPRFYRSGQATSPTNQAKSSLGSGSNVKASPSPSPPPQPDLSAPSYPPTANRWLVIRKLDPNSVQPQGTDVKAVQAWVIESDIMRLIDDPELALLDLQTDVSPFLTSQAPKTGSVGAIGINDQAEVFIGRKTDASKWVEDPNHAYVDLSLLSSSNQLFPDYQPHNSNVYSFCDNFYCIDNTTKAQINLTSATADYYVIGWHSRASEDPVAKADGNHQMILDNLSMILNNQDDKFIHEWLQGAGAITPSAVVCHGAMYGVEWNSTWTAQTRPMKRPGDSFAHRLHNDMPVAVGTTPMDALLAYLDHHKTSEWENDIWLLGSLLRSQSDSTAGQQAGHDEVQSYNYSREGGGTHYSLPSDPSKPAQAPDKTTQQNLNTLNQVQAQIDAVTREYQQKQWETFSLWWKFVSTPNNTTSTVITDYQKQVSALQTQRDKLTNLLPSLTEIKIQTQNFFTGAGMKLQESVAGTFNQQKDPTLFVGGLHSGWPADFLDKLVARIDQQLATFGAPDNGDTALFYLGCVPQGLRNTALALVKEFVTNTPSAQTLSFGGVTPPVTKAYPPLYHDQGPPPPPSTPPPTPPPAAPWRDRWESTQAWFPLFLEWECEYFHIDWDTWELGQLTSRSNLVPEWRYGLRSDLEYDPATIDSGKNLENDPSPPAVDSRKLSGRILLLPQPSFSLKGQLQQLFKSTPSTILNNIISVDEQKKLLNAAAGLPFASAPLSGFLDHLATRVAGNHLKPNVRQPQKPLVVLADAIAAAQPINLDASQLSEIGVQSHVTPYASLVPVTNFPAIKPAVHGQFKFTKLNIIDKFGQCACAIDPTPTVGNPPPLYPWMSDYFQPQLRTGKIDTGYANVIQRQQDQSVCEFMQISPQINQPARLNLSFVKHDAENPDPSAYWRPVHEWENPVWGWLVVNYVDNGVQFFTEKGNFYREVRLASPNDPDKTAIGPKWLPSQPDGTSVTQLDQLINKFVTATNGSTYLANFIAMITAATQNTTPAPGTYSQFMSSVVGKPLALVNAGLSLELSSDARSNQSTMDSQVGGNQQRQEFALLDKDVGNAPLAEYQYSFDLKLGDTDRLHDGLIGYFEAASGVPQSGAELNVDTVYTGYLSQNPSIVNPAPPTKPYDVAPFWLDPSMFAAPTPKSTTSPYVSGWNAELSKNVFGLILDPFVPLNVYSSILPVQPLQLPSWIWEAALKNLTAFFHFGPLLITDDVPISPSNVQSTSKIKLPALRIADWNWLQPLQVETTQSEDFVVLGVDQIDAKARFEPGPYTAVEGYLKMAAPIVTSTKASSETNSDSSGED